MTCLEIPIDNSSRPSSFFNFDFLFYKYLFYNDLQRKFWRGFLLFFESCRAVWNAVFSKILLKKRQVSYSSLILCFAERRKRTARLFRLERGVTLPKIEVFLTVEEEKNRRTGLCGAL